MREAGDTMNPKSVDTEKEKNHLRLKLFRQTWCPELSQTSVVATVVYNGEEHKINEVQEQRFSVKILSINLLYVQMWLAMSRKLLVMRKIRLTLPQPL